jgi:hypothetical protein
VRELDWLPAKLIELIPQSWYRPYDDVAGLLQEVLSEVAADPAKWLRCLDAVNDRCPAALFQLAGMLEQYQYRLESPPEPPESVTLAGITHGFFRDKLKTRYEALRPMVLAFCLREQLGPEWFAGYLPEVPAAGDHQCRTLPHVLFEDHPLRLVCWACRLFWA